jgi:hypothetical protein
VATTHTVYPYEVFKMKRPRFTASIAAAFLAASLVPQALAVSPTQAECERNRVAADQAAGAAVRQTQDRDKAAAGIAVGGTCLLLSAVVGFADMGVMSVVCGALSILTATNTPAEAHGDIAAAAHRQIRNPTCLTGNQQ